VLWRTDARPAPAVTARADATVREFATRRGEQTTVTLADGTRVTLAPESRMRVHPFGAVREVDLSGEAVFEVQHDERRPFLVRAGHAVTEDLGTTFLVRAYPGDTVVRVVVTEGAVALRAKAAPAGTGARLDAGEVGLLDGAGRAAVTGADVEPYDAWTRGLVVFRHATLADVAAELGRRYDVTIEFARPADVGRRVTVEMPAGPLDQVLDAVTVPLGLEHRRMNGVVVVGPAAP
jgi:transmembrane sensor